MITFCSGEKISLGMVDDGEGNRCGREDTKGFLVWRERTSWKYFSKISGNISMEEMTAGLLLMDSFMVLELLDGGGVDHGQRSNGWRFRLRMMGLRMMGWRRGARSVVMDEWFDGSLDEG